MSIYKNGKKIDAIYNNGKKVDSIYKNGSVIYSSGMKIKSFSECTDEEIAQYLDLHYQGKIDISKYWKIGDTRVVHIKSLLNTNYNSCAHTEQDMTMVIIGFNHDDLSVPIKDKTKAAISIGFKEIMANKGTVEADFYWGKSFYPVNNGNNYSNSPLRTWLNGNLLNALPSSFGSLIKEVNKKNLANHTSTSNAPLITKDKIWLLSYPEIFGTNSYVYYLNNIDPDSYEGTIYEYFTIANNRIKKLNNNGSAGNAYQYWLRSPSSFTYDPYGYRWCYVINKGIADVCTGTDVAGISPGFCL